MNKLPIAKRTQIIQLLVEGISLRATSRITDVSINTVTKLLVDVGAACQKLHDDAVISVTSQHIQWDEIWSFAYAENKNVEVAPNTAGDVWTWTGIDADSKLLISWYVGNRDAESAQDFMYDVKSRLRNRVLFSTNGNVSESNQTADDAFDGNMEIAQLVKMYNASEGVGNVNRYSSSEFTSTKKRIVGGRLDEQYASTPCVERQNLAIRMHCSTRLTKDFYKKVENHSHAIALHFVYYNFCKVHKSLRVTPAMEAELATRPMTIQQVVDLSDKK